MGKRFVSSQLQVASAPDRVAEVHFGGADFLIATVDFWPPDPRLKRYVSGYHRYTLVRDDGDADSVFRDVFFPAWSNIRFTVDAEPWSVRIGRRDFDPVPDCAFFGPTSHAGYVSAGSGVLVGIGLTPAGWARLHGGTVALWADRIAPLDQVFPALAAARDGVRDSGDPATYFDTVLLDLLGRSPAESPAIDAIMARLLDPAIDRVERLADGLGLNARQVGRLTRTCFGFTPKLLLRRARFLRAFDAIRTLDRGLWTGAIRDAGYWDGSHFLRDCHLFLDRTLGEFMAMERPINRISMRRRDEVLGAPMQSLYSPDSQS
jgi:hypothetical protein